MSLVSRLLDRVFSRDRVRPEITPIETKRAILDRQKRQEARLKALDLQVAVQRHR